MDLRERIVDAYQKGDGSCRVIGKRFGVSHGVVSKLVRQQRAEGSLKPHTDRCGRKRAVTGSTEQALRKHLREQPDATLEERRDALGLTCSVKTMWESVRRLHARFKKSHRGPRNRTAETLPVLAVTGKPRSRR
jgi:transposase